MGELRAALAAVAFLTRIPVGRRVELGAEDVGRAAPWFPLVGAGVGAATGAAAYGVAQVLPGLAAAGVALAVMAALTGALHLDAVADTADALGGSTRERALEIMRDHRIGSYGATALALDLLLRAAALAALAGTAHAIAVAAAAGAVSRGASVALAASLPYARAGEGTGAALALPMIASAADILREMATFDSAGISGPVEPPVA
ncbi:MAG TPA: adenosylcobinamide-GDP ribazoletransferase [Gaiellaceae bacterium]|nr:adenosylcobinamide-GDP ribazoletransferase [Gaiellaceae bacterium]